MHLLCFASLLLIVASLATARDVPVSLCKYDGNQREMNACAVRDYKAADAVLNAKYKRVMSALPDTFRQQLRSAQRLWLQKRDPQCRAKAKDSEGGTIWPLDFFGCLKTVTEQRTKELEQWQAKR
jgi:uncharacterized protein YecT (DUF1311 family)